MDGYSNVKKNAHSIDHDTKLTQELKKKARQQNYVYGKAKPEYLSITNGDFIPHSVSHRNRGTKDVMLSFKRSNFNLGND